jgi:hypothetical protein
MPLTATIEMWSGDTRYIHIPVDGNANGTTADWWMGKSERATGSDVWIKKSSDNPEQIKITADAHGRWSIVIKLNPEDTAELRPGNWYHELRLSDAYGDNERLVLGPFVLNQSLIRTAKS